MASLILTRWRQGHRTTRFPQAAPELPARFRGRPALDASRCVDGCRACADACPTSAIAARSIAARSRRVRLLSGLRRGLPEPVRSPTRRITGWRRASGRRWCSAAMRRTRRRGWTALDQAMRRLFGRSLRLRQVSAGGCNGCEAELVALGNVVFDLARFGIQFVASPRHADGIVITGPVTRNMELALRKTYEAVPDAEAGDRGRRLCHQRRSVRGQHRRTRRRPSRHSRRSLRPRLPAASADRHRRPAAATGAVGRVAACRTWQARSDPTLS